LHRDGIALVKLRRTLSYILRWKSLRKTVRLSRQRRR